MANRIKGIKVEISGDTTAGENDLCTFIHLGLAKNKNGSGYINITSWNLEL